MEEQVKELSAELALVKTQHQIALDAVKAHTTSNIGELQRIHDVSIIVEYHVAPDTDANGTYSIDWTEPVDGEFDSLEEYLDMGRSIRCMEASLTIENHNVSLSARCTTHDSVQCYDIRMLHPYDPAKDFRSPKFSCLSMNDYYGIRNLMTSDDFLQFVANQKFFLAV